MISCDQILMLAKSTRLELNDDELSAMQLQMARMLEHLQILDGVDLGQAKPLLLINSRDDLRTDRICPSLSMEQVLGNALRHHDGYYVVPPTVGERVHHGTLATSCL